MGVLPKWLSCPTIFNFTDVAGYKCVQGGSWPTEMFKCIIWKKLPNDHSYLTVSSGALRPIGIAIDCSAYFTRKPEAIIIIQTRTHPLYTCTVITSLQQPVLNYIYVSKSLTNDCPLLEYDSQPYRSVALGYRVSSKRISHDCCWLQKWFSYKKCNQWERWSFHGHLKTPINAMWRQRRFLFYIPLR